MKLDLNISFDKLKAKKRFNKLLEKGAKIELREIKPPRSLRQNAYQHALFSLYGIEFGHKAEYVKQVVFKIEANRELFIQEHVDQETGEITNYLKSSADLLQDENNLAITRFRNLSSERGLYLPSGQEYLESKFYIDKEIDSHKEHL